MTSQPGTDVTEIPSAAPPRKHLSLQTIMIFNVGLLIIVIFIGGIFSYINLQSGREMSIASVAQTNKTMELLSEIVREQLPLKKQTNHLKIAIFDFRANLDLYLLDESSEFSSLENSYDKLLEHTRQLEKIWTVDLSPEQLEGFTRVVSNITRNMPELKDGRISGNEEQDYFIVELMVSLGLLTPVLDRLEGYLDRIAEEAYTRVFESNRQATENAGMLAELIDSYKQQYFVTLLIVIGIVTVFQLAFFYLLKERLGSVIKITSAISNSGSLSQRIGWVSSDEIGTLAQSFNQMLDRLESAQKEIFANKAYLDDVFHSMLNALVVINPDKTIRTVNQALLTLLHYEENELIGSSVEKIFPAHPAHLCQDDFKPLSSQSYVIQGEEHFFLTKERHIVPVFLSCSVIRDLTGRNPGMVCVAQDISQLKQIERDRQKLEDQLQQSQKMEAIGTLAGGIAHDFNNILSTMQGFTWLLLADKAEDSEERDYLNEIYRAGERASSLIQQILTFSRSDKKDRKPLQLSALVKEALRFMRATIPKSIEIKQNIESDCPVVLANATQVHQIIINLCTNALHAMKNDQGVLTVSLNLADSTCEHDLTQEFPLDRFLRISVSDTGQGIQPHVRDRIFDPFFTTKEVGEGTGLGLSVVHGIVKNHNGRIFAHSETGKGTTFNVYLPVLESLEFQNTEEEHYLPVRGSERILIVEDEPSLAKFYEIALSQLGYRVTCEHDGESALERFKQNQDEIDVVFTDQAMPKMTGLQLSDELLKIKPDLPIILITGYKGESIKSKALALGILYFLEKPINIGKLTQTVRDIFDSVFIEADEVDQIVDVHDGFESSPIDSAEDVIYRNDEFKDIIPLFIEERKKEISLLLDAVEKGDYEEINALGHKMQGASEAFGFTTVCKIGIALKQSSMKGEKDLIKNKIHELKDYLNQLEKDYKG